MATGFNNTNSVVVYPIIGFRNPDGLTPGIYYWNGAAWVNSGVPIVYNLWYALEFRLVGSNIVYLVNNNIVGTVFANGATYFGDIIMQAYNFNDPALPSINQSTDSYDAYWDNLITSGSGSCDVSCGKKDEKAIVCHNGKELCVSWNAVQAHLNHGDQFGPCPNANRGGITDITEISDEYKLSIAPNPVISTATIKYELPLDSKVSIVLFDPQGKAISTLVDAERKAGQYNYTLDASRLQAGIYYYRMTAISGDQRFVQGQKLVIVR